MKRIIKSLILVFILILLLCFDVNAETFESLSEASGANTLSDNLPDEINTILDEIGVCGNDLKSIENITFSGVLNSLFSEVSEEAGEILPSVVIVIAILLLYSVFGGVFDSVSNPALSSVLSVVSALCIACVLLVPVTDLIENAGKAIEISANFMLAYIPVMTAILISAGQTSTGSGYSAMMVIAAEGVGQYFSKIISPLLSCFLTLGISSSIVPEIKLSGIMNFFSKSVKWLMSFVFTLFTGLLTLKTLFSSSSRGFRRLRDRAAPPSFAQTESSDFLRLTVKLFHSLVSVKHILCPLTVNLDKT